VIAGAAGRDPRRGVAPAGRRGGGCCRRSSCWPKPGGRSARGRPLLRVEGPPARRHVAMIRIGARRSSVVVTRTGRIWIGVSRRRGSINAIFPRDAPPRLARTECARRRPVASPRTATDSRSGGRDGRGRCPTAHVAKGHRTRPCASASQGWELATRGPRRARPPIARAPRDRGVPPAQMYRGAGGSARAHGRRLHEGRLEYHVTRETCRSRRSAGEARRTGTGGGGRPSTALAVLDPTGGRRRSLRSPVSFVRARGLRSGVPRWKCLRARPRLS